MKWNLKNQNIFKKMKREEVVKITEKAQCNREKNDLKNGSQEY